MFLWLWACTPDTTDVCPTAKNDTCDELLTCALGTDSTDCDAACKTWAPSDGDYRMAGGVPWMMVIALHKAKSHMGKERWVKFVLNGSINRFW